MHDATVVEARGLNHWFSTGGGRKQAMFDIKLSLPRGSSTVLMGLSGSGTTTLLVTHDTVSLIGPTAYPDLEDGRVVASP